MRRWRRLAELQADFGKRPYYIRAHRLVSPGKKTERNREQALGVAQERHREDRKLFNDLMRKHEKQNCDKNEHMWMMGIWAAECRRMETLGTTQVQHMSNVHTTSRA